MGKDHEIDLQELANLLAPLCRNLREDVTEALQDPQSPLVQLARDWRQWLFPDAGKSTKNNRQRSPASPRSRASKEQFADAYAQAVTFALLLARSAGAEPLTLPTAQAALAAEHTLLSRALQVLTDPRAQAAISPSLNLLVGVIGTVSAVALLASRDLWLSFYEDFLSTYDPKLRKDIGVYYTPFEVMGAQVRLIDDLLTNRLGKALGFADPDVVTLDPAVGTGTYLLGVIEHALEKVRVQQGAGAVPGQATALAENLYGFEIMVGPLAVSELRLSRLLADWGAKRPAGGTHLYLTNTLESPNQQPPVLPKVKAEVPVIVCLGNPPYDRHAAADETNKARTGAWVRWGEDGKGTAAIFQDFLEPALAAGHGVHVKNLYNLYVYFWRWALWKVFEQGTSPGPGVVSYISASSYLDGHTFCGMREHMRRLCDEIWILDLSGEGRGTRQTENVFAIQTPVALAVAARYGKANRTTPARVRYARLDGTREEKLKALNAMTRFASLEWEDCPDDWQAPFRPAGRGIYFGWPLLTELMPWQHSGAQFKRTWPISPDPDTLRARWQALLGASDRAGAFKETRDRRISATYPPLRSEEKRGGSIEQLGPGAPVPGIERYAYRSFDRQWILADSRLGDFLRPDLWAAHGDDQIYLTTLLNHPLGSGPALTATAEIPDLHHFRGSYGAKEIVPLYRDGDDKQANILPGLLDILTKTYKRQVTPEDILAYVYGLLAHPAFTERFARELGTRKLRVPITNDGALFALVCKVGAKLLWLHTYGRRYVPRGSQRGQVPRGKAHCTRPIPGDPANYPEGYSYHEASRILRVGRGEFAPVEPEVYHFQVSGFKVVQSWLGYRLKNPKGKKSSPLDKIRPEKWTGDFTTELLELLWILEATIAEYPLQAKLLADVARKATLRISGRRSEQ